MDTQLEIASRMVGAETGVLSLSGEVDVSNVQRVREAAGELLERGAKNLVFDLAKVEYMDSSGLGVLVGLLKKVKELGGTLAIAAAQEQVERLFVITGLKQIIPLSDDVEGALKEVGA